jgi:integrase
LGTLRALKKTWWLTALFAGARKGSIEALRWSDVDLDKKTIRFLGARSTRAEDGKFRFQQ